MDYRDAGHRPHAVHTGEEPRNEWDRGPYGITVTLDTWGPQDGLFTTMYDALQSNWGDRPSRSADQPLREEYIDKKIGRDPHDIDVQTGWARLTDGQRSYVESCFQGKTLPQILELLSFEFTIDGVARACTHQLVRSRIGAAFMQHGGRDNDWRHRNWSMPETIWRACEAYDLRASDNTYPDEVLDDDPKTVGPLKHCVKDWSPLETFINQQDQATDLRGALTSYLAEGRALYAALVDAGIPWQDARRILWMGSQTYIHAVYNYLALQGVCNKRLEFAMDWEINAVAQLMVREVRMKCHPVIGQYLQSLSDKLGVAAFAGLESWTPDGKHPVPEDKKHLPRTHVPEQAPFWVLHPDSMAGGPVRWIPTNGVFPTEF